MKKTSKNRKLDLITNPQVKEKIEEYKQNPNVLGIMLWEVEQQALVHLTVIGML